MKGYLAVAVLLACLGTSLSLRCYVCVACAKDGYSMPSSDLIDCGADATYCVKTFGQAFGIDVTSRSCAASCTESHTSLLGINADTWCCQGDECNSATSVTISLVATISALVLSLCFTQ